MVRIEVRTRGTKRIDAKFKQISTNVRTKFAPNIVNKGFDYIKRIMPRYSGAAMRALQKRIRKQSGQILQYQPVQSRRDPRPYHLWLNGVQAPYLKSDGTRKNMNLGTFQSYIRSGKVNYMRLGADYMRKLVKKEAQKALKNNK